MNCRTFQKKLEDYLEGGLDFPGRFAMERHSEQCYLCKREVAQAVELRQISLGIQRVGAPSNFEAAVLARIHRRDSRSFFWRLRGLWLYRIEWTSWKPVLLGISSLALFGLGILLFGRYFLTGFRETPTDPGQVLTSRDSGSNGKVASPGVRLTASDESMRPTATVPMNTSSHTPQVPYSVDSRLINRSLESADSEYVEYVVPGQGNRPVIMRLPKIIQMRYGQASEEHFIRNVSH